MAFATDFYTYPITALELYGLWGYLDRWADEHGAPDIVADLKAEGALHHEVQVATNGDWYILTTTPNHKGRIMVIRVEVEQDADCDGDSWRDLSWITSITMREEKAP